MGSIIPGGFQKIRQTDQDAADALIFRIKAKLPHNLTVIARQIYREIRILPDQGFHSAALQGHDPAVGHTFYIHKRGLFSQKAVQPHNRILSKDGHYPFISLIIADINFYLPPAQIIHPPFCLTMAAEEHTFMHFHRRRAVGGKEIPVFPKFTAEKIADFWFLVICMHFFISPGCKSMSPGGRTESGMADARRLSVKFRLIIHHSI